MQVTRLSFSWDPEELEAWRADFAKRAPLRANDFYQHGWASINLNNRSLRKTKDGASFVKVFHLKHGDLIMFPS